MNRYDADKLLFAFPIDLRTVDEEYYAALQWEVDQIPLTDDVDLDQLVDDWELERCERMSRRVRSEIYDGHRKLLWERALRKQIAKRTRPKMDSHVVSTAQRH